MVIITAIVVAIVVSNSNGNGSDRNSDSSRFCYCHSFVNVTRHHHHYLPYAILQYYHHRVYTSPPFIANVIHRHHCMPLSLFTIITTHASISNTTSPPVSYTITIAYHYHCSLSSSLLSVLDQRGEAELICD